MKVVVVSGGFDPLHSGHIEMFHRAKALGDYLIVGVNSDDWLTRKKGRPFMRWNDRAGIIYNLKMVDEVYKINDLDNTACDVLEYAKAKYPVAQIIFANGGDRTKENIPEMQVQGVDFVFGVGGDYKMNSSSWILEQWTHPKTNRTWGYYRVLHEVPGMKVKELTVEPGQSLSYQRHTGRSEYWIVSEGNCIVHRAMSSGYSLPSVNMTKHDQLDIPVGEWHQLYNPFEEPCRIVEIQYGDYCVEEDIERKI
jgi:cytidyltransferase-like protein